MGAITKSKLCKIYGISYKTLAKRLQPIAAEIHYSSQVYFSPKQVSMIKECLGDFDMKYITRKELKSLIGVSYKTLALWLNAKGNRYKNKRYFTPKEFSEIAEYIGVPTTYIIEANGKSYFKKYSLYKNKDYEVEYL
ncbi:hypothetical protein [Ferruginibacter sp.]